MRFPASAFYAIILASLILSLPNTGFCRYVIPASMSDSELQSFALGERSSHAEHVTAGDYSPETATAAKQIHTVHLIAVGVLTLLALGIGFRLFKEVWKKRTEARCSERRMTARYSVKHQKAAVTLHTPYGEIQAEPIDISAEGMQIVVTKERPAARRTQQGSDMLSLTFNTLDSETRILDKIPCAICWARKDRLGLRFAASVNLEPIFSRYLTNPVAV